MTGKTDSRVRHTRDAILAALPVLMTERGYERLTIQNVLDRAGVGRATFYAHFDSKDELLAASVANLRKWLVGAWAQMPDQRLGFTLPFFRHLDSHGELYEKLVVRESEVSVERHIRQMLLGLVREDLASRRSHETNAASLELAVQYVVGALWSTIVWWLDAGKPLSPEEVDALFQRLAFPGLDLTLGEKLK